MKISIKKIITLFVVLFMTNIVIVNAATGLNVVLNSQNPDPVEPGNFVYVNVKVSNSGSDPVGDATILLMENSDFKAASNEDVSQSLGIIPAYSSTEGSNSFVIAKYKIHVNEEAATGLNTLTFEVKTTTGVFEYDFDILVQDSNPLIEVESLDIDQINPGDNSKMSIKLNNINSVDLKNVKVALDLSAVTDEVITMSSGSNEKIIDTLKKGESANIEFYITVSPDAQSIPYLLPIKLSYKDTLGNSFENTVFGSVQVYSPPELSINVDSQDIYTKGQGKINLAIANPGSSKIKGVQMEILNFDDYEIIEGSNQYIGDLNPDDFQTLPTQIYIKNSDSAVLKVKLVYFDSYDIKNENVFELPLKIYNSDELVLFGFAKKETSITSYVGSIVLLIIGLIIGYVISNIRNRKKRNLKNR